MFWCNSSWVRERVNTKKNNDVNLLLNIFCFVVSLSTKEIQERVNKLGIMTTLLQDPCKVRNNHIIQWLAADEKLHLVCRFLLGSRKNARECVCDHWWHQTCKVNLLLHVTGTVWRERFHVEGTCQTFLYNFNTFVNKKGNKNKENHQLRDIILIYNKIIRIQVKQGTWCVLENELYVSFTCHNDMLAVFRDILYGNSEQ